MVVAGVVALSATNNCLTSSCPAPIRHLSPSVIIPIAALCATLLILANRGWISPRGRGSSGGVSDSPPDEGQWSSTSSPVYRAPVQHGLRSRTGRLVCVGLFVLVLVGGVVFGPPLSDPIFLTATGLLLIGAGMGRHTGQIYRRDY